MKTVRFFLIILISLSCLQGFAQTKKRAEFILRGTVNYPADRFIYFVWYNAEGERFKDSTKVTGGEFSYKVICDGFLDEFFIKSNPDIKSNEDEFDNVRVPIDNSIMNIKLEVGHFSKYILSGCRSCAALEKHNGLMKQRYEVKSKMYYDSMQMRTDSSYRKRFEELIAKSDDEWQREEFDWSAIHPDDNLAPVYLVGWADRTEHPDSLKYYFNKLSNFQQKSYYGKMLKKEADKNDDRKNMIGRKAPEFSRVGADSNRINLDAVCKGHYVLLDFWATWCLPCRASHPALGKLYDKYSKAGFTVIGIAQNDNDVPNWQHVIRTDHLQRWYNILGASDPYPYAKQSPLSEMYDVNGIPVKILIDGSGNIVGRYNDEKDLEAALKNVFHY